MIVQKHTRIQLRLFFCCSAAFVSFNSGVFAAESGYITPRTEFGAPDLSGTWSIATQTNLERAARFEGNLVISEEEAILIEARVQARNEASNQPSDPNREAPTPGQNVGGYNTFWMDPGERLAVVIGEIRRSDGKFPNSELNYW